MNTTPYTAPKKRGRPFQPGEDSRRHRCTSECTHLRHQFTPAESSAGFWAALPLWGVSMGKKLFDAGKWPTYRQGRRAAR